VFRLRFLSKSHLHAKTLGDELYGCVFCVQTGHTVHDNDATVFFSQEQLFAHLARHPHPLPRVPGIDAIEGWTATPPQLRNNFDLQLNQAPRASVMSTGEIEALISSLPTATAIETVRPGKGSYRTSPDRSPSLQFAIGAKIVGIEFPERFEGKWAIGWADQVRGAFPVEFVRLDAPPSNEIRSHVDGRSHVDEHSTWKAVARWKFQQKDKDRGDWLDFKDGETISNISCKFGLSLSGWAACSSYTFDANPFWGTQGRTPIIGAGPGRMLRADGASFPSPTSDKTRSRKAGSVRTVPVC
jgi:hypothetical protein